MNGIFHTLRKHSTAGAMNILGLAAAFAACFVLATQVRFAKEYNKCIPEWENVYRVEALTAFDAEDGGPMQVVSRPIIEEIERMPQVESAFVMGWGWGETKLKFGENLFDTDVNWTENSGLRALRPKMVCGTDTLATAEQIIMPKSLAVRMFGDDDPIGKSVELEGWMKMVTGVYEDFPKNCFAQNNCFCYWGDENKGQWTTWCYQTTVRLVAGTDPDEAKQEMERLINSKLPKDDQVEFSLRNVSETYTSGIDPDSDKGDPKMLMILQLAIVLLLTVSAINFANFTLSETPMRIKGINTRKVLGMTNWQLRRDFIFETVAVSLAAFLLSVGIDWLLSLSPWINGVIVGSISLAENLYLIIYIGAAAVILGILVGLYPAFYATSFPPALVLKGAFGLSPRGVFLRKSLMFVQLSIAFLMSIYLGVLSLQSRFIHNSDYGFAKDELLFSEQIIQKGELELVRAELGKIPGVDGVGFTTMIPGTRNDYMFISGTIDEKTYRLEIIPIDKDFLPLIGVGIAEGHGFGEKDTDCLLLSDGAKRKYPWMEVGKPLEGRGMDIVGVCEPFRINTTRQDNSLVAACFVVTGERMKSWAMPYHAVVRIGANVDKLAVKKQLEAAFGKLKLEAEIQPEFKFMDDQLQQTYEEEFRFIRQVELFALICLIVTLVGVFCLTMFETEYRRREIGIRRVLGTTAGEIVRMFALRQATLIIPAFVIAAPIAWRMSQNWLDNFAERTALPFWLPLAAFAVVTTTVLVTVAVQTWRATRTRPVEALNR